MLCYAREKETEEQAVQRQCSRRDGAGSRGLRREIGGRCREKRIGGGRAVNVREERRECKCSCKGRKLWETMNRVRKLGIITCFMASVQLITEA